MKRNWLVFAAALLFLFASVESVLACACCADAGTHSTWTGKAEDYTLGLLGEIKFEQKAELFMSEAGFEAIVGLDEIKSEVENDAWTPETGMFDLVSEFTKKTWRLTIKTPAGKKGTLVLPMPATMTQFKVDTRDSEDKGLGVTLYKEFRFRGRVQSGTGIFRAGVVRPATYHLIFQGRGNGCDNAEDFSHWLLDVDGPKANYRFNGKLTTAPAK